MSVVDPTVAARMQRAVSLGELVRHLTSPNPWVGALLITEDATTSFEGATEAPGGRHAEIVALDAAGGAAQGATLIVTLEPCSHVGRTPPCVDAIVRAGVARVVVGVEDPDPNVQGSGIQALRDAGISVDVGVMAEEVAESLGAYLHHRRTGRPRVILKLAATMDGRTAAANGSSKWITSPEARRDVGALRASCDAIVVGAGTVRRDDPELTARTDPPTVRQPLRIVLGEIPEGARVLPAESMHGPADEILDVLGDRGILQVLIEGGAQVAHEFVAAGLVDRLVVYLAPAVMGGDDGAPMLKGPGAPSIDKVLRGRFVSVTQIGDDLRVEVEV